MISLESLLEEAMVSTKRNHPNIDFTKIFTHSIKNYITEITKGNNDLSALYNFCNYFSRIDPVTRKQTRHNLETLLINSKVDILLFLFDQLYVTAINELETAKDKNYQADMLRYYEKYSMLRSYNDGMPLTNASDIVYATNNRKQLTSLINHMGPVLKAYSDNILKKNGLTINFTDIPSNSKVFLSNVADFSSFSIKDSFFAKYEYGNLKIDVASTRGYVNDLEKTQQDAVLSLSKDNCSLNVVADGVGGSNIGEMASSTVIKGLKDWFETIDLNKYNIETNNKKEILSLSDSLIKEIKERLLDISRSINNEGIDSSSTVVIAFVTPSFVSYINAGDSTAYAYNKDKDKIHQMSSLHSMSAGMSYEEARHNENNNVITSFLGKPFIPKIHSSTSFTNGNHRIILSSDGITDLISENNFVKALKGYSSLEEIVEKAELHPDIDKGISKAYDNISGIVIDIDNKKKRGL